MTDFNACFGCMPTSTADAPGRVNLIGEHTDYNGGFVLPTAIPQRCHVEIASRPGPTVRAYTTAPGIGKAVQSYVLGAECPRHDWLDYVQGVTWLLRADGQEITGFDVRLDSAVPVGSGLSSSAALTVSLMRALRTEFRLNLADVAIARLGQRVENDFVGARVGIMDPMAASLADSGTALFLDARSLEFVRVPLPRDADLVVLHSGVSHRLAGGSGYNTRRLECERAASLLAVPQLRDLTAADIPRIMALPDPLGRRARHVVSENVRVLAAVNAMRAGDLERIGDLFWASHASMRDDYEVSIPEMDLIVDLARKDGAIYGARLTGGGFGGSVVMLARPGMGRQAGLRIAEAFRVQTGNQPKLLVPES
jgi:galactokinase